MGDVNHNPGCECLSCHVARGRMLQEIDPIPPSGEIGRQLAEVTKRANEAFARKELAVSFEVSATHPLLKIMMANAERQAKKISDEIASRMFSDASPDWGLPVFISIDPASGVDVRNVDVAEPPDLFYPAKDCDDCQRVERDLIAIIAAKDARIAELKSELARRPAAFVDPDEKPEHNPFREFTKDRRMMGP